MKQSKHELRVGEHTASRECTWPRNRLVGRGQKRGLRCCERRAQPAAHGKGTAHTGTSGKPEGHDGTVRAKTGQGGARALRDGPKLAAAAVRPGSCQRTE